MTTMTTRDVTPEEMAPYVVRFDQQPSVRERVTDVLKLPLPAALFGKIFAWDLFNLVGKTKSPADAFACEGPRDTSVFVARMPPKFGPNYLHTHKNTWEILFVLSGKFRVTYGDDGKHEVILNPYDSVVVPPGIVRNFENISDDTADMLVVIAGADDGTELHYPRSVKEDVVSIGGDKTVNLLEAVGLRFMD